MGVNISKADSTQESTSNTYQSYQGTCNIDGQAQASGVNIHGQNADINQTVNVNGQCLMTSGMESITDVLQKAQNTATSDGELFNLGQVNDSSATSKNISTMNITNTVNQNCNISGLAQFVDSNVDLSSTGNFVLNQNVTTGGTCSLQNTMSASASLQQYATDSAASGKDKGKGSLMGMVGTIIMLIVGLGALGMFLNKQKQPPATGATATGAVAATAAAATGAVASGAATTVASPAAAAAGSTSGKKSKKWLWIIGGVVIVGMIITGIVFAFKKNSSASTTNEGYSRLKDLEDPEVDGRAKRRRDAETYSY